MIRKMLCINLIYSLYLHIFENFRYQFDAWVIDFHHYGVAYAGTQKMLDCAHLNSSTLGRYIHNLGSPRWNENIGYIS